MTIHFAATGDFWVVIGIFLVATIYFVPALIAWRREHHNAMAIFMLNILLGWTLLGWAAALIWSLTAVRHL